MAFHLGPNARTALRYAGIVVATLVVFAVALQLAFPYDRLKARAVEALADKYDVTINDVERGFMPGHFAFKAVTLRTRPAKADDPITTFYIERLDIDLHLFAALRGVGAADLDAKIGAGHLKGDVSVSKAGTGIHLEGTDLPSGSLPMRELLGLPMSGKVELLVSLDLPNETNKLGKRAPDWSLAEGEIDFSCPSGCSIGDGKTKLRPKLNARSAAMAKDGIEFGKVDIQSLFAEVQITPGPGDGKPGKLALKRFETKSLDGELKVDFLMTLMPDINDSPVAGCLRFKASEVLAKREPKTAAELTTTGALIGPDGLFHIKLTDKFRDIKRLPQTCGPETNTPMDTPNGSGNPTVQVHRPNLAPPPPPDAGVPAVAPLPPPQPPPPATPPPPVQPSTTAAPPNGPAGSAAPGGSAHAGGESEAPAGSAAPAEGSAPPPPAGP